MNGDKTLHPFFKRTKPDIDGDGSGSGDEIKVATNIEQLVGAQDESKKTQENRRSRKPRVSAQANGKTQKTLQEIVNPKSNEAGEQNEEQRLEIPNSCSSEPLFSSPRPKRRRTSQTEFVEVGGQNDTNGNVTEAESKRTPRKRSSPQVVIPYTSPLPVRAPEANEPASKNTPKKMLRLNANGKFSSPISKKPKDEEAPVEVPKRRGRPRKSKEVEIDKHLIAVMKYNNTATIGPKVDRILSGEERFVKEAKISTPKKQSTPRRQHPAKPTHPFFMGNPKEQQPPPKQESPRKASAVTPGKLRRQTMSERSPNKTSTRAAQDYAVGSGLLKDRLMFKHPGAKEPSWPSKEQAHVRGLDESEASSLGDVSRSETSFGRRKRKAAKVPFPVEESLLKQFSLRLKPEEDGELRSDGFREPHPSLTLPRKLLIPGREIARRVTRELSAPLADRDEDEIVRPTPSQSAIHPAIQKLYDRIPRSLSAFDEGRGETLSWVQKYEPSTTADVLQPSREMTVLKEWLTSLTVTAVESTSKGETKVIPKSEPKPKKKRRRKHDDMDDFLVDDDDDVRDMDELSDPEDTSPPSFHGRKAAKSVVQVASNGVKLSNAVLLSGPHGCGKTAAAHAAAKELGFKVFEISPCERRSGKDVVDKVGDMTENHLVKHHGTEAGEMSSAEEPNRIDEAFQRDLASGRQGKMNAFFKPKATAKNASPKKKAAQKKDIIQAVQKAIKKPPKDQQQSLILLEEVDILFRDDKDFWGTVFKLIESSKRPFILTCNDEDLVPLQAMSLHAVLRFSPPTVELATDYMLLIAAAEGHLLKRDSVLSLYQSKGQDLRASIAELNFWCQMGVGDPRVGLNWIFQRYPPGADLDAEGRKLRVASEGTYRNGMGLMPDHRLGHETQLLWARNELGVNLADLLSWEEVSWKDLPSLNHFSCFVDSISAADVYSGESNNNVLDTTQPPMIDKTRLQYIEGMTLLQSDELVDYADFNLQIRIATIIAAYRAADLNPEDVCSTLTSAIQGNKQRIQKHSALTRQDFTCFDAISIPSENALSTAHSLVQSAFDGPLESIATDLAPYVRSIVQYDLTLADQRERLNSVIVNGRHAKRARTTRAARSALEGSQRASTRRERWFSKNLDMEAVLATAGKNWPKTVLEVTDGSSRDGTETPTSSAEDARPSREDECLQLYSTGVL